jgi:peptidoglycan/LPS O-acetylase OafA/YrhL
LAHLYPVIGLRLLWQRLHPPIPGMFAPLTYLVIATVGGIVVGLAVYFLIEDPLTERAKSWLRARSRTRLAST